MFQKYALYAVAVLALLISAVGSELQRQTQAAEVLSIDQRASHPFTSSADSDWFERFAENLYEPEPSALAETGAAVSRKEKSVGSSATTNGFNEVVLATDEEPILLSQTSDTDLVDFYWIDDTQQEYASTPRRAHCSTPYGIALRGGWWDIQSEGDKTKIGEYQSLESSEFWDADGLYTDGNKTVDFFISGLDSEANDAGLRYFGPRVSADIEYQRFLRRLDHDPLSGMADFQQQTPGGDLVIKEELEHGRGLRHSGAGVQSGFQREYYG